MRTGAACRSRATAQSRPSRAESRWPRRSGLMRKGKRRRTKEERAWGEVGSSRSRASDKGAGQEQGSWSRVGKRPVDAKGQTSLQQCGGRRRGTLGQSTYRSKSSFEHFEPGLETGIAFAKRGVRARGVSA